MTDKSTQIKTEKPSRRKKEVQKRKNHETPLSNFMMTEYQKVMRLCQLDSMDDVIRM
jgi:hypothetical protein